MKNPVNLNLTKSSSKKYYEYMYVYIQDTHTHTQIPENFTLYKEQNVYNPFYLKRNQVLGPNLDI